MTFRTIREEPLPRLDGRYVELVHDATGARHIHVAVPDDNCGFAAAFPTVPRDSTGVAHILEHCALAGSKRFPVRDPFFSMLPRSLNTFMNAMTSTDFTVYPFSTRNTKDFANLLEVYLDAAFFPLLDEDTFRQEGWRHELDPELTYKGVVFNEMKGAMASPGDAVELALGRALFPDLTYAQNSGGDPERMPDLTWQALRDFHATHYHPSNAYLFTYGNLDLARVLDRVSETMAGFSKIEPDTRIGSQPRFAGPTRLDATYPLAPSEDAAARAQALVAWLTAPVSDAFEMLSLQVLELVLLDNPASPLRRALIGSGLGTALADGTGLHTSYIEAPFAAGLQGTEPDRGNAVQELVLSTLRGLADGGVDAAQVDAAIHKLELSSREVTNAGYPYFLRLFMRFAGPYLYGGDPYRAIAIDDDLARIERSRAEGRFFEDLIRRHLLDNPHRALVVVSADQSLEAAQREREAARLRAEGEGFGDGDRARVAELAQRLRERQDADEDLTCLPTLELSDVPLDVEDVKHETTTLASCSLAAFPQPTNGLVYADLLADWTRLSDESLALLPVLCYALTRMGAGERSWEEMAAHIAANTGGVAAGAGVRTTPEGRLHGTIRLGGKALARNAGTFLEILRDLAGDPRFEPSRLAEVVGELNAQIQGGIEYQATHLAVALASSKLTGAGLAENVLTGTTYVRTVRDLASDGDGLAARLDSLAREVLRSPAVCVAAEPGELARVADLARGLISALPSSTSDDALARGADRPVSNEARTASVPVAYNAKVVRTPSFDDPDAPALAVLSELLRDTFLHREIRESGGAYGANSAYDAEGGLFVFASFRDPNIARTFHTFDAAVEGLASRPMEADEVKEAILSASASLDPLLSPDTKGRRRFADDLAGYTIDKRAAFRRAVLGVTRDDLVRVAEAHLSGGEHALASVCSEALADELPAGFNVEPL